MSTVDQRFPLRTAIVGSLGLWLATTAVPAAAQTLEEALALAYTTNPQLSSFRARVRGTDERLAQARAGWRPTVTMNGSVGRSVIDRENARSQELSPRSATLSIAQPLYRGGRTIAGTERAKNEIQADRARLFATEQTVLLDTATAYFNLLRDEAVLQLNISNEQVLQRQLEATQDRFRVGEVTRTDVSQAESRLARTNADRIAAEGTLTVTRATFQRLVGTAPTRMSDPRLPDQLLPRAAAEATAAASSGNPGVIAAQFDEGAARNTIDEIRGELLPTVSANAQLGVSEETQIGQVRTNTAQVTAQVSVPLYESGATYSRVRAARQTASQRLIDVEVARRNAIEQSTSSFEALQTARARIESLQAQIRAAEVALEGVRQEANVGSRTVLDVLNAEQELLDAQVSLVRSRRDMLVAGFQLLSATGRLTAQALNLPVELYDFEANFKDVENRWIGTNIIGQ